MFDDDDDFYDDEDDLDEPGIAQIDHLIETNAPELQDVLLDSINDSDDEFRMYAALKLGELFHDVRAVPALSEALYRGNSHMRKAAANTIWEIGDTDAPGLIRALHFEPGQTRDVIADALELVGWFPDDPESEIAYRIATWNWREIVTLGEKAVSSLISVLSDPDGDVRRGAIWALGQIKDARAIPFLIECLADTSGDLFNMGGRICDVAAESLLNIGTVEAIEAVEDWRKDS